MLSAKVFSLNEGSNVTYFACVYDSMYVYNIS